MSSRHVDAKDRLPIEIDGILKSQFAAKKGAKDGTIELKRTTADS
jgi:hypothetical protein